MRPAGRVERRLELVCWTAATMTLIGAGLGWRAGTPHIATAESRALRPILEAAVVSSDTIAASARVVVESDPFRIDRRPTTVPYRPELEGLAPPPVRPKPTLALFGLVGSPRTRWAALLDGVPGRAGLALVHTGDTLAGLRVRRIDHDTVIVVGPDTTWKLTVRRAWQ